MSCCLLGPTIQSEGTCNVALIFNPVPPNAFKLAFIVKFLFWNTSEGVNTSSTLTLA